MGSMDLKKLWEHPQMEERAVEWFSQKWSIPAEAYRESMDACIEQKTGVPQWYIALDEKQNIVGGAGIIENDFHDRKDLSPNLCALFVEETHRKQGIARDILDFAREDMRNLGFEKLYLVTDHTNFYEKCGWGFLTMVHDDDGTLVRMYATSL